MNQQIKGKIQWFLKQWDLRKHNGNISNGEALIDKVNIESLEIYEN